MTDETVGQADTLDPHPEAVEDAAPATEPVEGRLPALERRVAELEETVAALHEGHHGLLQRIQDAFGGKV